jgi:hypothetical protein
MSSIDPKKTDARNGAKPAQISTDVANIPEPGVRAKGISEKTILERSAAEKPVAEKPVPVVEKPAEKAADKPAETASIPVEVKRQQPAPREKTVAKAAPVVAAPSTAAPVEAAVAPEEHRDANDLARAAIERLRGATEASPPRVQEAVRAPETPRVVSAPPVSSMTPIRPLPPPIMVSSPAAETFGPTAGPSQARPPYPATVRIDDPRRPTPPADIPDSRPLDLRAEAADPSTHEHTTVAEDVLSAAKSVFHAVLPK